VCLIVNGSSVKSNKITQVTVDTAADYVMSRWPR